MFEKEAKEYAERCACLMEDIPIIERAYKTGAEFGYNKGYHDAEEHYLNVIDSQHKLVDESKKKDFRKCMKCTDGTYQSGFKDGYNKANEWHYVKDGKYPIDEKDVEVLYQDCDKINVYNCIYDIHAENWLYYNLDNMVLELFPFDIIAWKEIVLPKELENV